MLRTESRVCARQAPYHFVVGFLCYGSLVAVFRHCCALRPRQVSNEQPSAPASTSLVPGITGTSHQDLLLPAEILGSLPSGCQQWLFLVTLPVAASICLSASLDVAMGMRRWGGGGNLIHTCEDIQGVEGSEVTGRFRKVEEIV